MKKQSDWRALVDKMSQGQSSLDAGTGLSYKNLHLIKTNCKSGKQTPSLF